MTLCFGPGCLQKIGAIGGAFHHVPPIRTQSPILLSLPDTKEFLHTAMAFSEILRIRLSIYAKIMLSWVSWFCSQRFIHSSTRLAARNGKEPLLFLVAHSGSCRSPGPHMVDRRMVNPAQAPLNRMRTPSPAVPWNGKCKDCVLQQQSLQFLTQQKHCRSFQIDPNGFLFSFDECTGRNSWLELCVFTCFHFDWLFWEKVRRSIFFLQFPGMQCFLYVLVVQSVATVAPLVCWPKVMTQVPAESYAQLRDASTSWNRHMKWKDASKWFWIECVYHSCFFMFYPNVRGFLYCKNKVNDIVFWSRVSPKNWCYRGSLSPCSTHPDTEPILLSLPDTKEFLHTAMAFSEILRIRLIIYAKLSFLILLPKIHPLIY